MNWTPSQRHLSARLRGIKRGPAHRDTNGDNDMSNSWKPTADEARTIRAYAAEVGPPQSVVIELASRINYEDGYVSDNILRLHEGETINGTDLHDFTQWSIFRDHGVELTDDGRAMCDLYVYKRQVGSEPRGGILTNVYVHVATINGKPRLVKLEGTGMATQVVIERS